jgi:hypothetical protein
MAITVNSNPKPAEQPAVAAPAPEPQGILADLDILIQEGVVERTVSPFKNGMRFTMHTLLNPERNQVSKEIPDVELTTMSAAEQAPKLPTLLYAITCIETKDKKYTFTREDVAARAALRVLLNQLSGVQIDMLYLEYQKMVNDLITIIETGVKKN